MEFILVEDYMEPVFNFPAGTNTCYVAGPEGFSETTKPWMDNVLIPGLQSAGVVPISPWELTQQQELKDVLSMSPGDGQRTEIGGLNHRIAARNHRAMVAATCMVASLDGQEVDSGTASEIGAYAIMHKGNRPIFGRRNDMRNSGEEGAEVNLQVVYWIHFSNGRIVSNLDELLTVVREFVTGY